jgi:hypothetical protein
MRRHNLRRLPALALGLLSALVWAAPDRADACGGTFCDGGPNAMPVDQTGENILFVFDGTTVEAHIQIQYDPDTNANNFAWVIPVTALPEFSVGSQTLFTNLLAGSVPTYGFNTTQELCGEDPNSPPPSDSGASATGGDPGGGDESDGEDDGPSVLYRGTVGAFDIVVLQDDSVDSLMQWLGDNNYQQDPAAAPIFQQYLDEGHLFVAFKLTNDAEVGEIHPVVLKYTGDESCVPIRLTRIAAQDDMDIRTFFLGDNRNVPINYRHVLINPLKIDWVNFAMNYKEVISLAVDAFAAEGNAFVTEYAGASNIVSQFGLYEPTWDPAAYTQLEAVEVIDTLTAQNLMFCFEDFETVCQYNHPLLQGILAKYLPAPDGLTPDEFYSCVSCYADQIDLTAWNGADFAYDFEERLVKPGQHAIDLLNSNDYLTRMYTTISPDEMMEDPIFQENPELPDVASQLQATRLVRCDGHATWTLPDGREVFVPNNGAWPTFDAELPFEEEVQTISIKGAPMTLVNNTVAIDTILDEWNRKMDPVEGQLPPGADDPDADPDDPDNDPDADPNAGMEGCGCNAGAGGGIAASLALLGLLAVRPGRRRRV